MKVCETCRHWHYTGAMDHDDGTKRGLCRRYPPNIGDAGRFRTYEQGWKYLCEDACATWPATDLDDWCGEHAPHEPATAEKDKEIEEKADG